MASLEGYQHSMQDFYQHVLSNADALQNIAQARLSLTPQVLDTLRSSNCEDFFRLHAPHPPGESPAAAAAAKDSGSNTLFEFVDESNVGEVVVHTKTEFQKFKTSKLVLSNEISSFLSELEQKGSLTQTAITDLEYSFDSMNGKFHKQQELLAAMQQYVRPSQPRKSMKLQELRNFFTSQALPSDKIMTDTILSDPAAAPPSLQPQGGPIKDELDQLFEEINAGAQEIISLQDEIDTCKAAFEGQRSLKGTKIYQLIHFMPGVNAKLSSVMQSYEKFIMEGDDVVSLFNEISKLASWYSQFILSFQALEAELKRREQAAISTELHRRELEEALERRYQMECEARRHFSQQNERYLPKELRCFLYDKPPVRLRVLPSNPHLVPPVTHQQEPGLRKESERKLASSQQESIFLSSASHLGGEVGGGSADEQKESGTSESTSSEK